VNDEPLFSDLVRMNDWRAPVQVRLFLFLADFKSTSNQVTMMAWSTVLIYTRSRQLPSQLLNGSCGPALWRYYVSLAPSVRSPVASKPVPRHHPGQATGNKKLL
jgi:hypothetical protein